jgi:hypothetical protein
MRHRDQDGIGRLEFVIDKRDAVLVRSGRFLAGRGPGHRPNSLIISTIEL